MIFMIRVHAYFKKDSNKQDYKGQGTVSAVKNTIQSLMREPGISVIVIENPVNNHRFKWDPSMDQRWREIGKPQDPNTIKAIDQMRREMTKAVVGAQTHRTPIFTGKNAVLKINGQVVAFANPVEFKMEYKK